MLGVPKPEATDLDVSAAKIMRVDPDMPLWLHGQWRNLADVADGLYSQLCEFRDIPEEDVKLYERALALRKRISGDALETAKARQAGDFIGCFN